MASSPFSVTLKPPAAVVSSTLLDAPPSPVAKIQAVAANLRDSKKTPAPVEQAERPLKAREEVVLRDAKNTPVPVAQLETIHGAPREEVALTPTARPVPRTFTPSTPDRTQGDLRDKTAEDRFGHDEAAEMARVQKLRSSKAINLRPPSSGAPQTSSPPVAPPSAPDQKSSCCINYLYLAIGLGALAAVTAAVAAFVIFATTLTIAIGLSLAAVAVVSGAGSAFSFYMHCTAAKV